VLISVQITPFKVIVPISLIFLPDAATREPPPEMIPPDELDDELLELLEELEDELLELLDDELLELLDDELLELLDDELLELLDDELLANSTTPDFTGSALAMNEVSCTVWVAPFGSVHVTATLACLQSTELEQDVIDQVRVNKLLAPFSVFEPEIG
jgi:hypothetical protein